MTKARVVVAEDEGVVALALERCLLGIGHQVVAKVATGEEAVRAARELEPDVVLMDIRLRGAMDGIEAAGRIQRGSRTPVIYLTAYSDEETLTRARLTQPYSYLLKPFNDASVRSAIEITMHNAAAQTGERKKGELSTTLLEGITEAVVATDYRGLITFANANAEKLLRRGAGELLGRQVQHVLALRGKDAGQPPTLPAAKVLFERKGMILADLLLEVRDAEPLAVDINLSPIQDSAGTVTGLAISFHRRAA